MTQYESRVASVCFNPIRKLEHETVASSCRHMRTLAAETARCTKSIATSCSCAHVATQWRGTGAGWDLSCWTCLSQSAMTNASTIHFRFDAVAAVLHSKGLALCTEVWIRGMRTARWRCTLAAIHSCPDPSIIWSRVSLYPWLILQLILSFSLCPKFLALAMQGQLLTRGPLSSLLCPLYWCKFAIVTSKRRQGKYKDRVSWGLSQSFYWTAENLEHTFRPTMRCKDAQPTFMRDAALEELRSSSDRWQRIQLHCSVHSISVYDGNGLPYLRKRSLLWLPTQIDKFNQKASEETLTRTAVGDIVTGIS